MGFARGWGSGKAAQLPSLRNGSREQKSATAELKEKVVFRAQDPDVRIMAMQGHHQGVERGSFLEKSSCWCCRVDMQTLIAVPEASHGLVNSTQDRVIMHSLHHNARQGLPERNEGSHLSSTSSDCPPWWR